MNVVRVPGQSNYSGQDSPSQISYFLLLKFKSEQKTQDGHLKGMSINLESLIHDSHLSLAL